MKKLAFYLILSLFLAAVRSVPVEMISPPLSFMAEREEDTGIVDVLAHAATYTGAPRARDLISEMDDWGVQMILISPYPEPVLYFGEDGADTEQLASFFSKYPDRFPIAYGGSELNPLLHGAGRSTPFSQENICPNGCSWATESVLAAMQAIADDPEAYELEFKHLAENAAYSGKYVAFGEISPIHYSLREDHPDIEFPSNHPWMLWLADLSAQYDMPILLHLEATEQSLGELANLLEHNREANIVWVHAGWSNTGEATASVLSQMLGEHSNLYLSLKFRRAHSPERQAAYPWDESGSIKSEWVDLFQNFPDRLMIGADPHFGSRDNEFQKYERVQKLLDNLPPEIAYKIEYENAVRLFGLGEHLEAGSTHEQQQTTNSSPPADEAVIPDCPADPNDPLFDYPPLALTDFDTIVPLGNLNPPSHTFPTDHIYFYLLRSDPSNHNSAPLVVPVYSPGRIWITGVATSEHVSAIPPYIDYSLYFSPCRQVRGYFLHVQSLEPALLEKIGSFDDDHCNTYETGGQTYRRCSKWDLKVEIQSGEVIGSAGGQAGQNALDMGAYDARVAPLEYVNPSVFYTDRDGFDLLHIVCPMDYYAEELRVELLSRFGGWGDDLRTVEPICGQVEQDEPGTVQGKWYLPGEPVPFPEDPHIALVHDNVDPTIGAFSVGNSLPSLKSGVYFFNPVNEGFVNRDFDQVVADDDIYCYELYVSGGGHAPRSVPSIILIHLITDTTLRIEAQSASSCGSGPWEFTEDSLDFDR